MPMPNKQITDNNYRYAFQGQEKDPETGMEAFELRLWDGRLGRWLSVDPAGEFFSPYLGMGNNPISTIDPDGGSTEEPNDWFRNSKTGEVKWFNSTADGFSDLKGASWSNTGYGNELLQFNGLSLSYSFQTLTGKNLTDLKLTTYEYDADSGRATSDGKTPGGIDLSTFDYSKGRQKLKGTGPIPEGNYFVIKNKIQKFDDLSYINQAYSTTGLGGGFKGGTYAWGENRFEIYPKKVSIGIGKNKVIRGDFFIHGGQKRGSAGCIDLCGQMNTFVKYFNKGVQNKVHLLVKY
jgi:RHS repeat-associated protein